MGLAIGSSVVVAPFAPLLKDPKPRAPQQTELVYGQGFDVYAQRDGWSYGRALPLVAGSDRRGYLGWLSSDQLGQADGHETHVVSVLSAPVFSRADLKSHIVMSLPMGARVGVLQTTESYCQIGAGAYISRLHLRLATHPERNLVAVARRYLGQAYIWGGNGARGVDCSGLVQMSLSLCGIDAPRDADLQEQTLGRSVAMPDQVGDLLFWPGHVGIMSTRTRLLHANATHMSVVEERLAPALKRMESAGVRLRSIRRL